MTETASDKYILNPDWLNKPIFEKFEGDIIILNPDSKHNQPERSKREDQLNQPVQTINRIDGVYEKLDAVL